VCALIVVAARDIGIEAKTAIVSVMDAVVPGLWQSQSETCHDCSHEPFFPKGGSQDLVVLRTRRGLV
jgi:hypothetical protein